MNIKINTNISKEFRETSITINAPELTDEIQSIVKYVSNVNENKDQIIGNKNNEIYFINLNDITCFYSKDKYNYIRTEKDTYKVKYKLYEIEDVYRDRGFIRISNSCIINMNKVECFDTSILGTILVRLKDNTKEVVSKRNVTKIMKILKERGSLR